MLIALILVPVAGCEAGRPAEENFTDGPDTIAGPEWTTDTLTLAPPSANQRPVMITEIRTGTYSGHERVTMEFEADSALPGVRAAYVEPPIRECGSGRPVQPVGERWIEVRLHPAAAHTETGEPTLPGREISVEGEVLRRIYRTCDFEGVVTFVLALSEDRPYRIVTEADPPRIAVDVRR